MVERMLKPCPFCGAVAPYLSVENTSDKTAAMAQVYCGNCETAGPLSADETDAESSWNERPPDNKLHRRVQVAANEATAAQDRYDKLMRDVADMTPPAPAVVHSQLIDELRAQVEKLTAQLALTVELEADDG